MPEDLALFDRLTGSETLTFVGQVHGLDAASLRARSAQLLDLMDLRHAAGDLVADYSHGMRKKISLVAALLPAPRLLFLDVAHPRDRRAAVRSHRHHSQGEAGRSRIGR